MRPGLGILAGLVSLAGFAYLTSAAANQLTFSDPILALGFNPPNEVQIEYYDIQGQTIPELEDSMRKFGPQEPGGIRRYALVRWYVNWEWPLNSNKEPEFAGTKSRAEIKLTFPRWQPDETAAPEVILFWENYSRALFEHEKGHLKFVLDLYPQVASRIIAAHQHDKALTTQQANKIGFQVLDEIRALDKKYDQQTKHGQTQGAKFVSNLDDL